jgi:uncharacterized protein involved in tolerance to divalent cations
MKAEFVELVLTCGSWQEAQRIADRLLERHLVACVEFMEIKSKSWWRDRLEETDEIKLIMQSVTDNFEAVEKAVTKLHSYDTFVLQQIPLTNLSAKAQAWLTEETKQLRLVK